MYGLKDRDLKQIQKKHEVQRDYLDNNTFTTSTGQVKSLLDVSFSANHSKRYYSEIINKINTINDIIATDDPCCSIRTSRRSSANRRMHGVA